MFADYSAEIKIAIFQPFRNAMKIVLKLRVHGGKKIARFTSVNSEITGRKLTKFEKNVQIHHLYIKSFNICLLYTSDAADDLLCVDLGGRRIIKKKLKKYRKNIGKIYSPSGKFAERAK